MLFWQTHPLRLVFIHFFSNRKPKAIVCRHFKLKLQEWVTQRLQHVFSCRSQADETSGLDLTQVGHDVFAVICTAQSLGEKDCGKLQGRSISGGLRQLHLFGTKLLYSMQSELKSWVVEFDYLSVQIFVVKSFISVLPLGKKHVICYFCSTFTPETSKWFTKASRQHILLSNK